MALTQVTSDVVHNVQSNITQVGTLTSLAVAGNLTISGTGQRIQGDFSNSSYLSRTAFQTSTSNSNTALTVLPNGTGTASRIDLYANSDPTTSSYIALNATPSYFRILSSYNGPSDDSKYMPIEFHTGGQNRLTIDVNGNVIVEGGLTAANLTVTGSMQGPDGQVVTNNGSTWDIDIHGDAGSANNASYLGGTPAASYALTSTVFGPNQTWQDVIGSRSAGVTYTNSTGKPIMVGIRTQGGAYITVSGVITSYSGINNASNYLGTIVPNGASYYMTGAVYNWAELR